MIFFVKNPNTLDELDLRINKLPKLNNLAMNCDKFVMSSILVTFREKYYRLNGDGTGGKTELAIEGYEYAFLAELVASYSLKTKSTFPNSTRPFKRIYRDDGLFVTV